MNELTFTLLFTIFEIFQHRLVVCARLLMKLSARLAASNLSFLTTKKFLFLFCRRNRSHHPNNNNHRTVVVKSCENVFESNVNTCPVII